MNISLEPGKYVIAVSGGVDSVVLLDVLQALPGLELVVAHFDHGIRADSADDAAFVARLAERYGLPFYSDRVELGPGASEARAREARYAYLHGVRRQTAARAIVTAHHQDDLIETALLNLLRGTKRRGLVSLRSTDEVKRPMLALTKAEIGKYARERGLNWREDSTNKELIYRRNQLRSAIKEHLTPQNRQAIISVLSEINVQNDEVDAILRTIIATQPREKINKKLLNGLPLSIAYELTAAWLRQSKLEFDQNTIKRIVIGARTLQNGAQIDVKNNHYCTVKRDEIVLDRR